MLHFTKSHLGQGGSQDLQKCLTYTTMNAAVKRFLRDLGRPLSPKMGGPSLRVMSGAKALRNGGPKFDERKNFDRLRRLDESIKVSSPGMSRGYLT